MLRAINYHILQLNCFPCVLDPNKLKSTHLCNFVLGNQIISDVDECKYLGIMVSVTNCDGDLKK